MSPLIRVIFVGIGFVILTFLFSLFLPGDASGTFTYGTEKEKIILYLALGMLSFLIGYCVWAAERVTYDRSYRREVFTSPLLLLILISPFLAAALYLSPMPWPVGWIFVGLQVTIPTSTHFWRLRKRRPRIVTV